MRVDVRYEKAPLVCYFVAVADNNSSQNISAVGLIVIRMLRKMQPQVDFVSCYCLCPSGHHGNDVTLDIAAAFDVILICGSIFSLQLGYGC
jgi:hypothetical protein